MLELSSAAPVAGASYTQCEEDHYQVSLAFEVWTDAHWVAAHMWMQNPLK